MQPRFCDVQGLSLEMPLCNDSRCDQHLQIMLIKTHRSSDGINSSAFHGSQQNLVYVN